MQQGWVTPDSLPSTYLCRRLLIPNQLFFIAAVNGAIEQLAHEYNWEQVGTVTAEEAAAAMEQMYNQYQESDGLCMIGAIVPMARDTLPSHMLPCDGSNFDRVDYPELYAVISGDLKIDPDTFQTPDLRSRFIYGTPDAGTDYATGGAETVELTESELPEVTPTTQPHSHTNSPHGHTTQPHGHTTSYPSVGIDLEGAGVPDVTGLGNPPLQIGTADAAIVTVNSSSVAIDNETVTVDPFGGDEAHENMPPYITMQYVMIAR